MLTVLRAIPAHGGQCWREIYTVTKRFWMGDCRPSFGETASRFDAPIFCVVISIGPLGNLGRLGSILWGKIKKHVISNVSARSLAIKWDYIEYLT